MLARRERRNAGEEGRFPETRKRDRSRRLATRAGGDGMNKTLVVDIGGTHVKLLIEGAAQRQFDSGPNLRPGEFVAKLKETTRGWDFENISIGFPSVVR